MFKIIVNGVLHATCPSKTMAENNWANLMRTRPSQSYSIKMEDMEGNVLRAATTPTKGKRL